MIRNRHKLDRDDVDLAQLADELSARLGRKVALSARLPAADPAAGGVLVLVGDDGAEVAADTAVVAEVIAAHSAAPSAVDPLDQLAAALSGATTVAKLRDALSGYVAAEKKTRRHDAPNARRAT